MTSKSGSLTRRQTPRATAPKIPRRKKITRAELIRLVETARPCKLSEASKLQGQGVYLIIYKGQHPAYSAIAKANQLSSLILPQYVGKAWSSDEHKSLTIGAERTRRHFSTLKEVQDLDPEDFELRFIALPADMVETIERSLVSLYAPVWNSVLTGFGNKHPGKRRRKQQRSLFDTFHPGRIFAKTLSPHSIPITEIHCLVESYMETWVQVVIRKIAPASASTLG